MASTSCFSARLLGLLVCAALGFGDLYSKPEAPRTSVAGILVVPSSRAGGLCRLWTFRVTGEGLRVQI